MKKNIIILLLLLISHLSQAQVSVGYTATYVDNSQMKQVRNLLNTQLAEIIKTIPQAAIVANFPSRVGHTIELSYTIGHEEFGFQIMNISTGGKIAYSDYSGEYINKYTLTTTRFGTLYRYHFKEINLTKKQSAILYAEISPGIILSTLKNTTENRYKDQTVDLGSDDERTVTGVSLQPMLGLKTRISRLDIKLAAGYDLDFGGKADNKDKTKITWRGLRAGIGVNYKFGNKK